MQAVIHRLAQLGSTVSRATHHAGVAHVEVAPSNDPFSPVLEISVESRPAGSYVSACVAPSALLRDFARVVRLLFTLSAVAFLVHFGLHSRGGELVRAVAAIGASWASAQALFGLIEHAVRERAAQDVDTAQLMEKLARLLGESPLPAFEAAEWATTTKSG
ncbi:MAG: hypothetical protein OXT09_27590 [Myxococcales bacterium]|nr:hypothetical protein [Myxococcales bacterium]